jgi:hypothetical protein
MPRMGCGAIAFWSQRKLARIALEIGVLPIERNNLVRAPGAAATRQVAAPVDWGTAT